MSPYDRLFPKPDGVIRFGLGIDHYPPNFPSCEMRGQGVWMSTDWWSVDGTLWHLCKDKRRHEAILAGAAETVAEFLEAVRT